jgi:hypothetical protein
MRAVDADVPSLLRRMPLALLYPDGQGLRLQPGKPVPAFLRGVLGCRGWTVWQRMSVLGAAAGWAARRFRCDDRLTVAQLCARLPVTVRTQLIEPLCVAALNTPADTASASVFLRVLRDALFAGPGSSDLLLPLAPLSALLAEPAARWFDRHGVSATTRTRVMHLRRADGNWLVDGERFDAVVLACGASEAARLCEGFAPQWARVATALRFEPIVTVYLHCAGAQLPCPMTSLHTNAQAPAQFAFDLGALGRARGVFAFVISGARPWVERGLDETARAVLAQATAAFAPGQWPQAPAVLHAASEKRATFQCTPALQRPPAQIAAGLWAAGDYVAGPYPATLEGAVLSGELAARGLEGLQQRTLS